MKANTTAQTIPSGWLTAPIALWILWQGAYFPIQFILLAAYLLLATVLSRKTIVISPSVMALSAMSVLLLVSALWLATDRYTGLLEWIRFLVFPLGLLFSLNQEGAALEKTIYLSCLAVAVVGLLAYLGAVSIPGAILESSGRLQSVLQYANTTALLMLIGILYSLQWYREARKGRWLALAGVFLAALLLTGSRTSFVTLLILGAVGILVHGRGKQRVILLAATGLGVLLLLAWSPRVLRLSLTAPTLIERVITYQDALGVLRTRILPGLGIGNWQAQQFLYQSAPYQVRYIHSFYLQLFLDGGFAAVALFLAALVPGLVRAWRQKSVHFYILAAIALHMALDMDMAFGGVIFLAMASLSQVGGEKQYPVVLGRARYGVALPALLLLLIWGSEGHYNRSVRFLQAGQLEQSMASCQQALRLVPFHSKVFWNMAQSTREVDASERYLNRALEQNEYDLDAMEMLVRIYAHRGEYHRAIPQAEELLTKRRYHREYQELYRELLHLAVRHRAIAPEERDQKIAWLEELSQPVNPLYTRYILPDSGF